ncbi:hypothetical protein [Pseudomonas subflava]|uniref:hypothetical protein n=1 Tax=Pseudomonas subflava TaxID=2952933 RepID=UPI00207A8CA1|nr:hypothetical protein [Pseudomonas subflava]
MENHRSEYYGISWFAGSKDLVLSHSGLDNATLVDVASYASSEVGWVSAGSLRSKNFLSQPHQIICAPDNRVVCTNTGRNVVTVIDFNHAGLYQEAGINDVRWDRLSLDQVVGDHLNSVFLTKDFLYVIAHRHSKGAKLGVFSYPSLELLSVDSLGARTGLHNFWMTQEGQRISCHSETGCVVDLDAQAPLWEAGDSIYTRGLAASRDYVVVGESQKTGRDLRRSSWGGIWVLDRKSWKALDYISLGPYGAVNEVRILDVPDEAHHSSPFKGLQELIGREGVAESLVKKKLALAKRALSVKEMWSGYELIFGSPANRDDGYKVAESENLCLMVKQLNKIDGVAKFAYSLQHEHSHISIVLNYSGMGGDEYMTAFLVQRAGEEVSFSVWRHDGTAWGCLPGRQMVGIPDSAVMALEIQGRNIKVIVNENCIMNLSKFEVGNSDEIVNLGVRWIGSIVRPM